MENLKPHVKNVSLPPRGKSKEGRAKSVGYFYGDLPYVVVHMGARSFNLPIGQSIPAIADEIIYIQNPFARSATAQISYNCPISNNFFDAYSTPCRQREFVTYHGLFFDHVYNTSTPNFNAQNKRGFAFHQLAGSALYRLTLNENSLVMLYPNAPIKFLDFKPTEMMPKPMDFVNTKGQILDTVKGISGHYTNDHAAQWVSDSGYDHSQIRNITMSANDGHKIDLFLEEGTAIFVRGQVPMGKFYQCRVELYDHGVIQHPSNPNSLTGTTLFLSNEGL